MAADVPGSAPHRIAKPAINWLMGIAVSCLLAIIGLKVFFDTLQEDLRAKSANEQARLFVGEEIVRGIHAIEKDLYLMASTSNLAGFRRMNRQIEAELEKLRHDLEVLRSGGTVRRQVHLNVEGRDEMVREATYIAPATADQHVMELIEISPLLDQIFPRISELEGLLAEAWTYQDSNAATAFLVHHDKIDAFLKRLPPFFDRLDENANRLFFDSSERLRELEAALQEQRQRLKKVEVGLLTLILVLSGLVGMFFLRRINETNRQLGMAVEEMRAAKEHAEQASRAKSEFVSRMSHELRTPLNAILGFAQLLESEPLPPSQKEYVGLINSSGKHLLELINAVLDHAKIEAGGMTLEKIAFDFHATIDAVRIMVAERAAEKGLQFDARIAPDLPQYLEGDPTRLRQILINLLNNAVKFTASGSVELRIAREEDRIVFSVRDTGIGMDDAALARLFKPFSQADGSITRKFGGTGLGLMISKDLIEAMGGRIEVDSAPGSGTCFWFWLPLKVAGGQPLASQSPIVDASADFAAVVPGSILLVDDNRVNQKLAGAMLERLGLKYVCADNGLEALSRIASADFALVLMDMEMPEMDGVSATREIRAREAAAGKPRQPIIAMTANALQEDRERCFAAGMDGYIPKPITLDALKSELQRKFGAPDAAAPTIPVTHVPPSPPPGFDRARAIAMMGDEELFRQIAAMFVTDLPGYLAAIEQALAARDAAALARGAHTLKGLFATFAAGGAENIARELEKAAHANRLDDCPVLVAEVQKQGEGLAALLVAQ